jgi:hypothetical protein
MTGGRFVKHVRLWRSKLRPRGAIPAFWHIGRPNFGDDINPAYWEWLGGRPVRFASDRTRPHLLGIGSILDRASSNSIVVGSGFLRPEDRATHKPLAVIALRGELSFNALGDAEDALLGDPLVLCDRFVPRTAKRFRLAWVPHVTSIDAARGRAGREIHVIDPTGDPWQVIVDIAASELVMSQSLHGLIIADAFAIPNLWIAPSPAMIGGRFKFDDYFSTLDAPKPMLPENGDLIARPPLDAFSVGRYRFDKDVYAARMKASLDEWANRLREGRA